MSVDQRKKNNIEKQLAVTLSLIVGVFSLSTLPLWIVQLLFVSTPNIHSIYPKILKPNAALNILSVVIVTLSLLFVNSFRSFFILQYPKQKFSTSD